MGHFAIPMFGFIDLASTGRIEIGDLPGSSPLGSLRIGAGGRLAGNGFIIASDATGTELVSNEAGVVAPGRHGVSGMQGVGRLNLNTDFSQGEAGTTEFQFGGLTSGLPPMFDQIAVAGDVSLQGVFSIEFVNGFVPSLGNTFDVVTFTGSHTPDLPTIQSPAGYVFSAAYLPGALRLTLIDLPPIAGDFDGDGDVDGADFVAWQTHFPMASGATLSDGDADGDGDVDGADFVVWQTNFPTGPDSAVAPVPEPATWLGLLAAIVLLRARQTSLRRM
jgi:hypothetical protein